MGCLSATLPLSPLDQIAPRIYVRSIFVFTKKDGFDTATAVNYLKERFHIALVRWPFLAGQIHPARGGMNRLELVYSLNNSELDPTNQPKLFCHTQAAHLRGYTFEELVQCGFRPRAMDKDILSLSPEHPKTGESCPPVTLKITEMDGGLCVCFSTHHTIFDGGFIRTFLDFFANSTMNEVSFYKDIMERPTMDRYTMTNINRARFPEYDFSDTPGAAPAPGPKAVCLIFKVGNATLKSAHQEALELVLEKYGPAAFVSMADTLSAIFWVHVTRARVGHLSPSERTSFTTAADARPRLRPAFPSSSWGNVYTQTAAGSRVGSLVRLDDAGRLPEDAFPAIAEAAWLIRQAIDRVKEPDYIPSRIALAANLRDPAMEGAAFRKANRPDRAGLGCSVWVHMGADVDFGIPGTGGKADYIRKTYSANDGNMNIMQRRGVTKGDADWEVLLALREDDMSRILQPNELGRWAKSWVA